MKPQFKILNTSSNPNPQYATKQSAAMDIQAYIVGNNFTGHAAEYDEVSKCIRIFSGGRALIHTGLFLELPQGYEAQIRPRSGLAIKKGITVLNSPGTIDADYRGEVGVILINLSDEPFEVYSGDRIAQILIQKLNQIEWTPTSVLSETERGEGGFGHTGK